TASRLNSAVYRLLVLLFLLTAWDCFLRDLPSQYQAVQLSGGTSLRYVHPDHVHVFADGRIVDSGGPELAERLEEEGYEAYVKSAANQ
ncbi:hypothetical protein AB0O86_37045, partial [Streptomyces hirsutus]